MQTFSEGESWKMRRCTSFAIACLVATIGVAALATGASAAAPEFGRCLKKAGGKYANSGCTSEAVGVNKYEWKPGPGPKSRFQDVLKPGTIVKLKGQSGAIATCTGATGGGEIANAKELTAVIFEFTGCQSNGLICESPGGAEGEIVTNTLSGVLGSEVKEVAGNVIEILQGPNEIFAEYSCGGIQAILHGSSEHKVKTDKMLLKTTEKYTGTLSMTLLQTFQEKIEVNTIV
jgi:hypothetical protein